MTSKALSIGSVIPENKPEPIPIGKNRWSTRLLSPLWLCLLATLAVHVYLVIHTNGVIDGDEAVVGIQAQHILRGEFPIYFAGQPYMGILEAYLIAAIFAIFGSSVWALRAEPILLSLVVVWLVWKLAGVLAQVAALPPYAQKIFQTIAALFVAIPPLYDTVAELRTLGGYIEIFILMLLLLLSTVQLTQRWQSGASPKELAWRWVGIGFIGGLGLWINPLIVSAILTSALWLIGSAMLALYRWKRQTTATTMTTTTTTTTATPPKPLPPAFFSRSLLSLTTLPAAIIGFAPALYWGATHQWQNITYILSLNSINSAIPPDILAQYPNRLSITGGLFNLYTSCIAPRIMSGALPPDNSIRLNLIHLFTLTLGLCCLLFTFIVIILSYFKRHPSFVRARRLAGLPLLFGTSTAFVYIGTTASAFGLASMCSRDLTGRYATPLFLALPFFYATTFTIVSMSIYERYRDRLTPHTNNQPIATESTITARLEPSNHFVTQALLFSLLLASLALQTYSYSLSDAGHMFQSPYCLDAPTNYAPIIHYMQQEHIHYAWATNFLAYPIVFESQGRLILSDPLPVILKLPSTNRFPDYVDLLRKADRPSFLFIIQRGDRHSHTLTLLQNAHITYRVAYFPSEPDTDVMIVTPLNRTLSPFDSTIPYTLMRCFK